MLPAEMISNFYGLIGPQFEARDQHLHVELSQVISRASARGALHSSRMVIEMVRVTAAELQIRAAISIREMLRAASAYGVQLDRPSAEAVKERLGDMIRNAADELRALTSSRLVGNPDPGTAAHAFEEQLYAARDRETKKMKAEIDLLVANTENAPMRGDNSGGNTFNIGSAGIIQTGAGSFAIYNQIDAGAKEQIRQVLERVRRDVLQADDTLLPVSKNEILDAIAQSETEVAKDQPNSTVVKSLLLGLGQTISTVASLEGAYEAVKGVLAYFGVTPG